MMIMENFWLIFNKISLWVGYIFIGIIAILMIALIIRCCIIPFIKWIPSLRRYYRGDYVYKVLFVHRESSMGIFAAFWGDYYNYDEYQVHKRKKWHLFDKYEMICKPGTDSPLCEQFETKQEALDYINSL